MDAIKINLTYKVFYNVFYYKITVSKVVSKPNLSKLTNQQNLITTYSLF